jgi:hypothetical protein
MKDRKEILVGLSIMLIFVILTICFFSYMSTYVMPDPVGDCKRECDLVNGTFVKYTPSGYAPSECWCRIGGIPERIG